MDEWYEESAVNVNAKKSEKKYRIVDIASKIFGFVSIITIVLLLYFLLMLFSMRGGNDGSEEYVTGYRTVLSGAVFFGSFLIFFGGFWLLTFLLKRRINISYDYVFVSGELRITKVFNVNRRKFLYTITPEEILAIGDAESESYERLCGDPSLKTVFCTSNLTPAESKFFMYIHAGVNGTRNLYVLECREELLMKIMKYANRGVLAHDYVMQEKKEGK